MANLIEPDEFSTEEIEIIEAIEALQEEEEEVINQVGGAFQVEEAYELKTIQQRHIRKFNTIGTDYEIQIAPILPRGDVLKEHFNAIIYKGPEAPKKIYLYYYNNHYGVITTMTGFLNRNYYCTSCNKGYDKEEHHNCKVTCSCCHRRGCQVAEGIRIIWKSCPDCNRFFKGEECYENHKERKTRKGIHM